ncbi:MAG: hypothetical protein FJ291_27760 [Planctomycetes bacterium]|nr:hypothetical protein [Planctomycetota bacterium]
MAVSPESQRPLGGSLGATPTLVWAWGLATALACGGAAGKAPVAKLRGLTDKTLVAWLQLASTTQRAGSALTLIDASERFDAIVFAEVAPARWMAGSDFFRRTQRDQAAWPAETADDKALLQIAIAYKGREIAIYRNAKPYASYTISEPQSFGPDTSVLIGLRYIGHMGPIGHLAAAIEEARVYDVALDASALAALRPNKPSEPKPIALWAFEDGTADDAVGTFPKGRLVGGARIAGGKLHLNGKDACVIAESAVPESPGMFYRPRDKATGVMWDTWLFLHAGTYHLFYLAKSGGQWDNISMATSADGVHWTERGRVLSKADGVTWMGTGSTWKSPAFERDGRFQMNFSEWRGPRQTIFFAESKDLLHWTRLGKEHEFVQDTRWYEEKGRWDCIWTVPREGGGLYGYWTATPKGMAGFGFGQTLDGAKWEALPPPRIEWGTTVQLGGSCAGAHGMWTFTARRPEGPFRPAEANYALLTSTGHGNTYFARFFPTPGGLLVNHHSIARGGMVYLGTLKRAVADKEGALRLSWWEANERLKHEPIEVKPPTDTPTRVPAAGWPVTDLVRSVTPPKATPTPASGAKESVTDLAGASRAVALLDTEFQVASGVILEGMLPLPANADAKPSGLYIEHGKDAGTAILVNAHGVAELGPMAADGSGFKAENRIGRETAFGPAPRFRLLIRHSLIEFYLNDLLIQCYSLPAAATGRLGLIQGGAARPAHGLKAWR